MNLVCFANHTGGGIVCDLLNNANSPLSGIRVRSTAHGVLKMGDTGRVHRQFDKDHWQFLKQQVETDPFLSKSWVGTHCHPSCIPDVYLNEFTKIIAITTETWESKWYRYLRLVHGNLQPTKMPIEESASYLVAETFESHAKCVNIEFKEVVNGNFVKAFALNTETFNKWTEANNFLYTNPDPKLLDFFKVHNGNQ
jgi:hypothetical protein